MTESEYGQESSHKRLYELSFAWTRNNSDTNLVFSCHNGYFLMNKDLDEEARHLLILHLSVQRTT